MSFIFLTCTTLIVSIVVANIVYMFRNQPDNKKISKHNYLIKEKPNYYKNINSSSLQIFN
jgi:uncharacterized protein YxeA